MCAGHLFTSRFSKKIDVNQVDLHPILLILKLVMGHDTSDLNLLVEGLKCIHDSYSKNRYSLYLALWVLLDYSSCGSMGHMSLVTCFVTYGEIILL